MTTPTTPPTKQPDSPLAVAAMVCGAVSLTGPGLLLGIPALVLGVIALKRGDSGRGLSIAGIVTGAVSTLLSLIFIAILVCLAIWGGYDSVQPSQQYPAEPTYNSSQV